MGVYILLDKSRSMLDKNLYIEAVGSVNGYVANLPLGTGVTLATFDTLGYDLIRRNVQVRYWNPITNEEAYPRGGTPLLDSMARMIWKMLDDNDERSILVVMTDGEELNSQHFNKNAVAKMIDEVKRKGWEVIFLGANFDKVGEQARGFGLDFTKSVNMSHDNLQSYTRGMVADKSSQYLASGAIMSFSEEEKAEAVKPKYVQDFQILDPNNPDAQKFVDQLRNEKRAG